MNECRPPWAAFFCTEMTHAWLLRECAASRADGVPESAAEVYEYLHSRQIEKAETVRRYQEMYRK